MAVAVIGRDQQRCHGRHGCSRQPSIQSVAAVLRSDRSNKQSRRIAAVDTCSCSERYLEGGKSMQGSNRSQSILTRPCLPAREQKLHIHVSV